MNKNGESLAVFWRSKMSLFCDETFVKIMRSNRRITLENVHQQEKIMEPIFLLKSEYQCALA